MPTTSNFLVSNLRFLMDKRGLNPNSLSDSMGNVPPQATIFRILNGESLTPRDSTLAPLAVFFGTSIKDLKYSDLSSEPALVDPMFSKTIASSLKARKVIALAGTAGLPEKIWADGGALMHAQDGYAIIASDDEQAFLVPVLDDAMAPRYQVGEYALVEPGIAPEIEDDVLMRLATGQVLLRRLLSRRAGFKVGLYRSGDTQTFAPHEISWLYYVSNAVPARKVKK